MTALYIILAYLYCAGITFAAAVIHELTGPNSGRSQSAFKFAPVRTLLTCCLWPLFPVAASIIWMENKEIG